MIRYEHRAWYDAYGTGNFTEDKTERFELDISPEQATRFVEMWKAIGCTHYETSKAHFFDKHTDARHFTQYILYK